MQLITFIIASKFSLLEIINAVTKKTNKGTIYAKSPNIPNINPETAFPTGPINPKLQRNSNSVIVNKINNDNSLLIILSFSVLCLSCVFPFVVFLFVFVFFETGFFFRELEVVAIDNTFLDLNVKFSMIV